MVFQDYALFPHLSVEKNIAFGIDHLSKDRRKSRVKELLKLVNLEGFEKRYPHQLSGGQQQRIALARTLAPGPELLLLDEPFSNLDAVLKDKIRCELNEIIKKIGITTILVSHDREDAEFMQAREILMN
jgi:iron(III) transport system ATP-binding protein